VQTGDYHLNPYFSFDFLKNWSNLNFRAGVSHTGKRVYTNTRLRLDEDKTVTLYHKTQFWFKEWKLGFQGVVNVTDKSLLKKDVVLGYEKGDISIYLLGEQDWKHRTRDYNNWREFFSQYRLTALFRRNPKEKYGVEVIADPKSNEIKDATSLVEYKHTTEGRIKAKINKHFSLTLLLERKINSQLTASIGAQIPLKPTEGKRANRAGLKLAWNL